MKRLVRISFSMVFTIFIAGCGNCIPEKVNYNDSRLESLWKAVESVDRTSLGFTSISNDSDIRLEISSGLLSHKEYDIMLHIYYKNTSRTIAFRKNGNRYFWIGEQERFYGPMKFTTPDGTFNENIMINYDIQNISGWPVNQLVIRYSGPNKILEQQSELKLEDALSIIKKWDALNIDIYK